MISSELFLQGCHTEEYQEHQIRHIKKSFCSLLRKQPIDIKLYRQLSSSIISSNHSKSNCFLSLGLHSAVFHPSAVSIFVVCLCMCVALLSCSGYCKVSRVGILHLLFAQYIFCRRRLGRIRTPAQKRTTINPAMQNTHPAIRLANGRIATLA